MGFSASRTGFQRAGGGSSIVPDRKAGSWFRDDFFSLQLGSFTIAGTGSNGLVNTVGGTNHPGIVRSTVAAAATPDRASYNMNGGSADMPPLGGGAVSVEHCCTLNQVSDGVNNFAMRVGIGALADFTGVVDLTNAIYFENDFGVHANSNWWCKTAKAAARTSVDSGIAAVAGTFVRLGLFVSADGTTVTFKVNDTAVASINTNIPNSHFVVGYHLVKTLGAAAVTADFDFVEFMQTFTVPR